MNGTCGERTSNPSLIEIVTDSMVIRNNNHRRHSNLASCSLSSASHDEDMADEVSIEFPQLRKAGSFPMMTKAAPPRRPSRSSSLERDLLDGLQVPDNANDDDEEDEIDHQKFRQLLLGVSADEASHDGSWNAASWNGSSSSFRGIMKLKHRKSCSSAPPKFPSRQGSDSEHASSPIKNSTAVVVGRINREDVTNKHRKSLPSAAFRPMVRPVRRRRRHKSFIQEMLTPGSEGSSKSLRLPPKLPSRSESERSLDGTVPSSVFCSAASTTSVSTDAPKRPRRSLSPIDGDSLRSFLDLDSAFVAAPSDDILDPKIETMPVRMGKRQLPFRAKTFSADSQRGGGIEALSKQLLVEFSASKPQCTRAPPKRSRTFSFFVKPMLHPSGSESSASRCA